MKMNDKVIIAFLVSMGLFSTAQASQYVASLSVKDKVILTSVNNLRDKNTMLFASVEKAIGFPVETDENGDK